LSVAGASGIEVLEARIKYEGFEDLSEWGNNRNTLVEPQPREGESEIPLIPIIVGVAVAAVLIVLIVVIVVVVKKRKSTLLAFI